MSFINTVNLRNFHDAHKPNINKQDSSLFNDSEVENEPLLAFIEGIYLSATEIEQSGMVWIQYSNGKSDRKQWYSNVFSLDHTQ